MLLPYDADFARINKHTRTIRERCSYLLFIKLSPHKQAGYFALLIVATHFFNYYFSLHLLLHMYVTIAQ